MMTVPDAVRTVLQTLTQSGYAAVLVGGCVRDACMGLPPHDFDAATSATPDEVRACFSAFRTLDTGLKHGTVTVLVAHTPVEVTTFRIDGDYRDHRHPSGVTFTTELRQDLARRDFTVNAMAFDGKRIYDPFGGQDDLEKHVIRCVGDADRRFDEDGLRILRAMRFASTLGFSMEENTAAAMHRHKELLRCISVERIWAELRKLLCGRNASAVLTEFADVLRVFLPEADDDGVRQMADAPETLVVRLALLLQNTDAGTALRRLHADNRTIRDVSALLSVRAQPLRRMLSAYAPEIVCMYWDLLCARGELSRAEADANIQKTQALLSEKPCLHVRDLAVNGGDLQRLGLQGAQIGRMLQTLLDAVLDGALPNARAVLLQFAAEMHLKT